METPPRENRMTTRGALAEIPARLSLLNMTETSPLQDNNTGLWNLNVNVNIPSSYLSPSPSPDEIIIQQRGRRRIPVDWSPINERKSGERTPVKNSPSKSTIILRSTPRKKLYLGDPKELQNSPDKRKYSPNAKRSRIEKPYASSGPLSSALRGLSQEQLINLIQSVVKKYPNTEKDITSWIPEPDIKPLEEKLNYLKKNIYKSLPNTRLTSKTDSPAYSRAATHLLAFKKCLIEQGRQLVDSQHWSTVIDYTFLAWSYVRATPLWDNPPHNATRRQCFKSLVSQCMTALKKGIWSPEQCQEFRNKLDDCSADNDDIQSCLKYLDSIDTS